MTGCTSKSGELDKIQPEKVVIIDSQTTATSNGAFTFYKVNRINHGVVDYIQINGRARYETGDTIYHRFQ